MCYTVKFIFDVAAFLTRKVQIIIQVLNNLCGKSTVAQIPKTQNLKQYRAQVQDVGTRQNLLSYQ